MPKALIWTDPHIHAHKDRVERLQNCLDVLDWVFRTAADYNVDYIFFLGDLFHERSKINVLNYLRTFEVFMKHMIEDAADRDMYLLVGNHDMYHRERWDVNSVKPLTAIPRVHLIDKPTQLRLGGRLIDWMPYTENPVRDLDLLKKKYGGAGDLLLGHMAVHGAKLNVYYGTRSDVIVEYDSDMVVVDQNVFADWKKVKLGHYHGWQILGNIEYIGSPMELTFGEAFQQKHIQILDLETLEEEYVVNTFSPKHLIITPQDIQNETYDLNSNFVRLAVDNLSSKETMDIKREIATNYKILSLDIKQKEKKVDEDKTIIENARAILMNIQEMLDTFMKERGVPTGLDDKKLRQAGLRCLEEIAK